MEIMAKIAEERIREAMERGEFNNLPGAGRPIEFEDDSMVPRDLRMAFKILKNSGLLPPEVEVRKEIASLKELMGSIDDDGDRMKKARELDFLMMKLDLQRGAPSGIKKFPLYEQKFFDRFLGKRGL